MDRTLVLLRHAKSSWKDQTLGDFARPLAPRGRRAAPVDSGAPAPGRTGAPHCAALPH